YSRRKYQATVAVRQWNHNHKDVKMDLNDYQNWQRAQKQKARYQQRIANQRQDYLHKLTTALVKKYDVIVIEDLKAKN
ncbi:transposase, partial [Limosilactobacillus fermentum]